MAGRSAEDKTSVADLIDERRLLSVLSFMRKERMSIIQREIVGMRQRLHGARQPA